LRRREPHSAAAGEICVACAMLDAPETAGQFRANHWLEIAFTPGAEDPAAAGWSGLIAGCKTALAFCGAESPWRRRLCTPPGAWHGLCWNGPPQAALILV